MSSLQLTAWSPADEAFVASVEDCTLGNASFRHVDHLRLAFLYLRGLPLAEATVRMTRTVQVFATHHGALSKYHETLTIAWMRLVASAAGASAPGTTFEGLLAGHRALADSSLPLRFYSRERLYSEEARRIFLEPDLEPLPPVAP
jgi:hypothetical protein